MPRPIIGPIVNRVVWPVVRSPLGSRAGRVAAALLPDKNNADLGLLIGASFADDGWALHLVARRHEYVQATADQAQGSIGITYTMPNLRDNTGRGTRGNGWRVILTPGTTTQARGDSRARTYTIEVADSANTLNDVAAAFNRVVSAPGGAVVRGNGARASGNLGTYTFSGGLDPESISGEINELLQYLDLKYHSDDTFQQIIDAAPFGLTGIQVRALRGTVLTNSPVAPDGSLTIFNQVF